MKNKFTKTGWQIVILFFFSVIILSTCKNTPPPPKDLSKLEWLIGTWEVNDGRFFEEWEKINDKKFIGKSYKVTEEKDTVMMETIELVLKEKEIHYIPNVHTPKGIVPTTFKMTSDSDQYFLFENPKHDFPKKISYTFIDKLNAKARIEDDEKEIDFEFKKVE